VSDEPALRFSDIPPAEIHDRMGIEILEAGADRVVGTMRVAGNRQPVGLLHGGASCVLAESLGSYGATLHAGLGSIVVGTDINATHHRAVRDGVVTGVATPVHLGRTMVCYEIVISDEQDRRVCTARLTCAILPARSSDGSSSAATSAPDA
jgi:uncharacterized protein (TIGR00369 family)